MRMTSVETEGFAIIDAYGTGGFRISGRRHEGSVILHQDRVFAWLARSINEILPSALDAVIDDPASRPQILLIGCGARFTAMPPGLRKWAEANTIAADIMDTGAAARTYNILRQEDRPVAAALIAID